MIPIPHSLCTDSSFNPLKSQNLRPSSDLERKKKIEADWPGGSPWFLLIREKLKIGAKPSERFVSFLARRNLLFPPSPGIELVCSSDQLGLHARSTLLSRL